MAPAVSEGEGPASAGEGEGEFLVYWVSWLAIVSTLGLFSSGLMTSWKIYSSKNVGSVSHIPFIAASLNCSLWMMYGILKPDTPVTYINAIGLCLQIFYILVYHCYCEIRFKVQRDSLFSLATVLSISLYYTCLVTDQSVVVNQMGIVCNFFTILFFASPLLSMADVVRSKSTEMMSFPLTVMSVATSLSWALYGVLVADGYIIFPNAIGLLLASVQVSLFVMYRQHSQRSNRLKSVVETPLV